VNDSEQTIRTNTTKRGRNGRSRGPLLVSVPEKKVDAKTHRSIKSVELRSKREGIAGLHKCTKQEPKTRDGARRAGETDQVKEKVNNSGAARLNRSV